MSKRRTPSAAPSEPASAPPAEPRAPAGDLAAGVPAPGPGASTVPADPDELRAAAAPRDDAPAGEDAGEEAAGQAEEQADEQAGGAPSAPRSRKRKGAEFAPPPPERLDGAVEAMLLSSGDVLTAERLRDLLGLASAVHVREALQRIRERWAASGLSVELQEVAGGVRVVTRPEYAEYVRRLARLSAQDPRLSQGQLETLSIVAYRQPVARPEVEKIRGVQVGDALRALLDRKLIKVLGRSDQPGRPLLYGTTTRFLTVFGLNDVKDLPTGKDLARL